MSVDPRSHPRCVESASLGMRSPKSSLCLIKCETQKSRLLSSRRQGKISQSPLYPLELNIQEIFNKHTLELILQAKAISFLLNCYVQDSLKLNSIARQLVREPVISVCSTPFICIERVSYQLWSIIAILCCQES